MTKKIVFSAMIVTLMAVVAMPSASAACLAPTTASTFGVLTAYWLPVGSDPASPSLQSWQLGAPATWQGIGCDDSQLFLDPAGYSMFYNLSGCGVGCPATATSSTLAVLAQVRATTHTSFLLDTVVETFVSANNFEYGPQGNHQMIDIPRPRVISTSRVGNIENLNIAIDSIAAGLFGPNAASAVTGFNILTASAPTDPGRDADAYTLRQNVPSPGGAGVPSQQVTLDCTNPLDQWIVTQIVFENGAVLGDSVGAATRVHCDQSLANPGKYKIVPKRLAAPTKAPQ